MDILVEIFSANMHEYQKTVEMLGGILTKTIENIIRFSSQCVFDFRRKCVFAHTVFAQVVRKEEKKQTIGSDLIRCQDYNLRL